MNALSKFRLSAELIRLAQANEAEYLAAEDARIAEDSARLEAERAEHIRAFALSLPLSLTDAQFDAAVNAELATWRGVQT